MNYNIIKYTSLLADSSNTEVAPWIASSFPIIEIIIAVLLTICSIFMIVAVVAQKGESNGVTGVTGQADTFYNRNKGGSLQGKLKKWVLVDAIIILVLAIAFLILSRIYQIV